MHKIEEMLKTKSTNNISIVDTLEQLLSVITALMQNGQNNWMLDVYRYLDAALILSKGLAIDSNIYSLLINTTAKFCLDLFDKNYLKDAKELCHKIIELPANLLYQTNIEFSYDKNNYQNLDFTNVPSFFCHLKI